MATLGNGLYGLDNYGVPAAYYAPGPPEIPQRVWPPEVLDWRTPLMSIAAEGTIGHEYSFYFRRIRNGTGWCGPRPRQIVRHLPGQRSGRSPCQLYLRDSFRQAVAGWMALPQSDRDPFEKYVTHYGLVMLPRSLYIRYFMRSKVAAPENPCPPSAWRDKRKIRRTPGRT